MKNEDMYYSVKCGLSSFIATYIAGVLHPLDLLKTRFQSTLSFYIQAMMENKQNKI